MTLYLVHRRECHKTMPECEQQLIVEDAAFAHGYTMSYQVVDDSAYNVFVELATDLEFVEFKLRCA
jgi:hypothetical protein